MKKKVCLYRFLCIYMYDIFNKLISYNYSLITKNAHVKSLTNIGYLAIGYLLSTLSCPNLYNDKN